jgi:Holliday junction DNA helicase RuvB
MTFRLDYYDPGQLAQFVKRSARILGVEIADDAAEEIAGRSRGTPRIAVRLLRRVRDFCDADGVKIDRASASKALARLEVDEDGLDALDRRYLIALVKTYSGGPVGADTLAAALSEARDAIEEVIEPYLMQQGFVARTPRGRVATPKAWSA